MIVCIDVHYGETAADTACVAFPNWTDSESAFEFVVRSEGPPAPYQPGQFYKRELPYLLRAIEIARPSVGLSTIVVDGYVWLDAGAPGLGAHLYEALERQVAVVGVAKTVFRCDLAIAVRRGQSRNPLFVTSVGVDAAVAAESVRSMHGPSRVPTLLKRVDGLARGR